jgi:hypothetical protein
MAMILKTSDVKFLFESRDGIDNCCDMMNEMGTTVLLLVQCQYGRKHELNRRGKIATAE